MSNLPPPNPAQRAGGSYQANSGGFANTGGFANGPGGFATEPADLSWQQNYTLAGFWIRFFARVADGFLALLYSLPFIVTGVALVVVSLRNCTVVDDELSCTGSQIDALPLTLGVIALIVGTLLHAFLYVRWIGKKGGGPLALRIGVKVVDFRTGNVIGIPRAIGRFFGQFISSWIFYLGYLWMLWDKDKQTWHDKMVNSVVIRK
jgi:uncharacterized RDD family membrane protein YckC